MRKTLTVLATAATVAIAAVAAPTGAEARWGWRGPGLFGGLIAGGLIAGALAPRYYGGYYPRYYGYYNGPYCWRRHFNGWRWVAYRVC
ncbi:MAG TPA: hypothetical protein VG291_18525 [Xanthobacteraceae bacterium]|jgi:hypothetical protein|nr:hypothetical protein [Xanthobacteraceae bacterium]